MVAEPLPDAVSAWVPDASQVSAAKPSSTATGSENVTDRSLSGATPIAPSAGVEDASVSPPQAVTGDAELPGAGAAAVKSAALESVSLQPPSARTAAVVAESPGAGPAPSKKLAVSP